MHVCACWNAVTKTVSIIKEKVVGEARSQEMTGEANKNSILDTYDRYSTYKKKSDVDDISQNIKMSVFEWSYNLMTKLVAILYQTVIKWINFFSALGN